MSQLEAEKNNQIEKLQAQIEELNASEFCLKDALEAKELELSLLNDQMDTIRNDGDIGLKQFERKFQGEIMNKEEQIVQLTEDFNQAHDTIKQIKAEHEANLNILEQKYCEQLVELKQQNELNSSYSDLEFESQIKLKQGEVDRLQIELGEVQEKLKQLEDDGESKCEELYKEIAAKDAEIQELRYRYDTDMAEYYRQVSRFKLG